ncbi:hypothetical protein NEF87_002284 [Candidatus Lokiarchaeum ossiferum]|uniref:Uncharacterized protein n=1 Tax=Candidatus Lokiarchaeum ossiferum TaxID=2951803 RepID=A0ABY6HR65_9ARCH|nr:hypothetical protein NEF87_002284 [Candidatus Lokiarchaeum sp. B-35]
MKECATKRPKYIKIYTFENLHFHNIYISERYMKYYSEIIFFSHKKIKFHVYW